MSQFLNAFPLREGGSQRPGWMCLIEAQICAADSSFSFLWPSHKSPYLFEDPSCAFGAALLQGPTRGGLSHISFHAACRIVSCSVVMLTRFPTICDYHQTCSPLEKGAAKGRDGCASLRHKSAQQILLSLFYGLLISHPTSSRIYPAPLARPFSNGLPN